MKIIKAIGVTALAIGLAAPAIAKDRTKTVCTALADYARTVAVGRDKGDSEQELLDIGRQIHADTQLQHVMYLVVTGVFEDHPLDDPDEIRAEMYDICMHPEHDE